MSGIYIHGMEMPKRCQECPFERPYNGYNCAITKRSCSWGLTGRPSYCPLVPVPPHGRLGDMDAIARKIKRFGDYVDFTKDEIAGWFENGDFETIIPADKED